MNETTIKQRRQHPLPRVWSRLGHQRISLALVLPMLQLTGPAGASAHTEVRPTPETLWTVWEPNPFVAVALLLVSWLYLRGTAELWRRAGTGRGVHRWQVWSFLAGIGVFAIANLSPLDALGGAIFSAHMVQHLGVFLVAPALFAASRPMLPMIWAMPGSWRRAVLGWWQSHSAISTAWHGLNHWISVLLLYAAVLWLWHVPSMYNAALESEVVHAIEHASFAAVAFMFWSAVLEAGRPKGIGHGGALIMVFLTALHGNALGAGLTFANVSLYASHDAYAGAWGLTPLEDQQLAGLIMWIPMGVWLTGTALVLVGLLIQAADRSVRRMETEVSEASERAHIGVDSHLHDRSSAPGRN